MRTKRSFLLSVAALVALVAGAAAPATAQEDPQRSPRAIWWNETTTGVQVNGTYTPIAGNFADTNPQTDIIWYAPGSGIEQVWVSLNNGTFAKQPLQQQVKGTYTPVVGDFSGDELDDILWYGPGTAPDSLWVTVASHTFQSYPLSINGDYYPVVLHDTASKDNVLWWKPGAGAHPVWAFTGTGANKTSSAVSPPSTWAGPTEGDFDGDGDQDLFWYAAGSAADRLDWSNGSGGFSGVAQSVSGTYYPVVGQFTANQGTNTAEDIVWWKFGGGAMPYWTSNGNGSWTKTTLNIPVDANPLYAEDSYGYIHLWTEGGTDYVWFDNAAGADYFAPTGNTSMPGLSRPIPRTFVGGDTDIFWYRPGTATDRLFWF